MRNLMIAVSILLTGAVFFMSGCGKTTSPETSGFKRIDSDTIYSVRYDESAKLLTVITARGIGHEFKNVPQETYDAFMAADAKDDYFQKSIQGSFESTSF
jgi:hypothetical protein